ncbi:MAG: hypothetical protein ACI4LX_05090 [Treponema sp.]
MIREIFVTAAFLLVLAGITAGIVSVQKISDVQMTKAARIMEAANEPD